MLYHNINSSVTYKHSGELGDIIISLAFVQARGGGCFGINTDNKFLTYNDFDILVDLLKRQQYITKAFRWAGEEVNYDLDLFRNIPKDSATNICHRFFLPFDIPYSDLKWLDVDPNPVKEIVIARSLRNHNPSFPWTALLHDHRKEVCFLGLKEEYKKLRIETQVTFDYFPTNNLLQAAQVIAGSKVFVGNQSCLYAIAEGLKHPLVQESNPRNLLCVFDRPSVYYFTRSDDEIEMNKFINTNLIA